MAESSFANIPKTKNSGATHAPRTALVEELAPNVVGRHRRRSVARLSVESDNIGVALEFALGRQDVGAIARFLQALLWFWISGGRFSKLACGFPERCSKQTDWTLRREP